MGLDYQLRNKVALVTGASSGLGERFALALAQEGARVAIAARRMDKLRDLALQIEQAGGQALPVELDQSQVAHVRTAADTVERLLGPIEILVNNAGVSRQTPAVDVEEDYFDWIMDTNAKGVFFMAQAAGRQMIRHGIQGRIINIASTAAVRANPRPTNSAMAVDHGCGLCAGFCAIRTRSNSRRRCTWLARG